jgi:hypothetical protein
VISFGDEVRGWTAIDPQCRIGASCLEFGSFVGNAGDDGAMKSEKRKTIVEAIEMLSESSGENEERVYAGAFFEFVLWTSRMLQEDSGEHEVDKRETLEVFLEIGRGVDLERIGKPQPTTMQAERVQPVPGDVHQRLAQSFGDMMLISEYNPAWKDQFNQIKEVRSGR